MKRSEEIISFAVCARRRSIEKNFQNYWPHSWSRLEPKRGAFTTTCTRIEMIRMLFSFWMVGKTKKRWTRISNIRMCKN